MFNLNLGEQCAAMCLIITIAAGLVIGSLIFSMLSYSKADQSAYCISHPSNQLICVD